MAITETNAPGGAAPTRAPAQPLDRAPDSGLLVLDPQRSVTPTRKGCPDRKTGLRIKTAAGWYDVPCKRRSCPVCGPRRAREDARVLVLDAREQAPEHCITLTTADPDTSPAAYRLASATLWKRLRRLYGRVEYYGHIEWTTGKAARSGGHRRMHGHYLVKFLDRPEVDVLDVERIVRETWEACTGAYRVEVAKLLSPGAAIGYLSLHHRKPEQAAPAGWRGMVGRPSKGYFHRPVAELREQARQELRIEAIAHARGIPIELAALELAASPAPQLVAVIEPREGLSVPEYDAAQTERLRYPITDEARDALARDRTRLLLPARPTERRPSRTGLPEWGPTRSAKVAGAPPPDRARTPAAAAAWHPPESVE